jgi:multicomponent K+:H+ antiporter subunit A
MSLVALGLGLAIYVALGARFKLRPLRSTPLMSRLDGKRLFEHVLAGANTTARTILRRTSSRHLQVQMLWMFVVAGAVALGSALVVPLEWGDRARVPATTDFLLLWLVGGAAAVGAAWQAKFHRLMALTLLGVVGIVVCLTFAWFSAPDLALTQLAVEAVTMVLFLLGLRWLPKRIPAEEPRQARRARWRRGRDFILAALAGTGIAALSYAMLTRTGFQSISPYFIENALPLGGGTNVVNVMLVDFRAFDTFGEITVLGTVALTIYALLRRFRPPREVSVLPPQQQAIPPGRATDLVRPQEVEDLGDPAQGYLLVPSVLVRLLLPLAMVVALHLFLRGHNQPGGGFVAGLVLATAFIAQYMVGGTEWVEDRMDLNPPWWIAGGLLLVIATGLGSLAFGHPFLTTHTAHLDLPWLGELHLPSAALFDAGVFAVVLGATLLMLTPLAHQSLRARRRERH